MRWGASVAASGLFNRSRGNVGCPYHRMSAAKARCEAERPSFAAAVNAGGTPAGKSRRRVST
ncbi:MAG: hypothetical protein IPQ09_14810 [Myxococcales bacterium]|nr:hypothetical protein [Myxococcales bacterium]